MRDIFPYKPGDWVARAGHNDLAKVKSVYDVAGEILLDLWIYDHSGVRIGRRSPACGGPRTFEPACPAEGWGRITEPEFPIRLQWIYQPDGRKVAGFLAGESLPPAQWRKPKRKGGGSWRRDDKLKRALEEIADGHNDPRARAKAALR